MNIAVQNEMLDRLFAAGEAPQPEVMLAPDGGFAEWRVTMLTGLVPNLGTRLFRHRKMFMRGAAVGGQIGGCNIMFEDYRWGWFKIELKPFDQSPGNDTDDGGLALLVDYAVPQNNGLVSPMRDYLRTTKDPNLLIGRFYFHNKFEGFFTLDRLGDEWPATSFDINRL